MTNSCSRCGQQLGVVEKDGKKEFYCNTCRINETHPNKFHIGPLNNDSHLQSGVAYELEHVQLYAGNDCGIVFLEKLFKAKQSLRICSPWISKEYLEKLIVLSRNNKAIFIITSKDNLNSDSANMLKNGQIQHKIKFKFAEVNEVHSKIYVIDSEFAVIGSANFTVTGLKREQNNHVAYTKDENDVKKCAVIFDDLFRKLA